MSKFTRGEKGEEVVSLELSKSKIPHRLINNLMLEDRKGGTHQVDHIFICHKGIFVIETKNYYGEISDNANDSIWLRRVNGKVDRFANPLHQNSSHIRTIKEIIGKKFEFISLVVFVKNNAPYMPDDNVIDLNNLLLFINEYPNNSEISNDQIEKIYTTLLYAESDIQQNSHLENIKQIRENRNKRQEEIKEAIETRVCPKCKSKLENTENGLKCTNKRCNFKVEF